MGQGARSQGGVEGGAERPGKADKRHHLRGPERPAPSSRGAASATRASGLRYSLLGSSEPATTPRPPVPSSVTSALPPSWRPRPARPLGATPAATRLRCRCPPGPAAELCRPAPLSAAPRARPRSSPAPPRAGGRAPSLQERRERGDVPPRPSARGRERPLRDGMLRGRGCEPVHVSPGTALVPVSLGGEVPFSSEGHSSLLTRSLLSSSVPGLNWVSALAIRLP